MIPFLVDTHCHLHFPAYDADRATLLARLRSEGMWAMTIGTTLANSARALALAEAEEGIWASAGLHPEHITSTFHDPAEGDVSESCVDESALETLARSSKKVVAIGETGLDFFRIDSAQGAIQARAAQEKAFLAHVRVARTVGLPVVIHCRDALSRLVQILHAEQTTHGPIRGVVHSFTGTWDEARPLLELGLMIAVNGIATFPPRKSADPAHAIDRTIENIPFDRLLLETDAPYLAPVPHRGARNEPVLVRAVATHVAQVRGVSLDAVAQQTTQNARAFFNI